MKMEQSVPKRRHINFRRRVITQKKAYNIQNKAKVWNQEDYVIICSNINVEQQLLLLLQLLSIL
jgi:hypothetical protein